MINFPLLLTNFKATKSAIGSNALKMADIHQAAKKQSNKEIAIATQISDIEKIAKKNDLKVFAQHTDNVSYGSFTGKIPPEIVKDLGAFGTILNHSENRFTDLENLGKAISLAKKAGLFVVCCAENADEGKEIFQKFAPDLIAIEPPELIGGDISVSTAKPELIEESVQKIGKDKVLVGAGIKNSEDVKISLSLGAVGVLVASGITKNNDPKEAILDLVSAF